ncbi:MAG: ribonuclease R [Clostridiales bacterium]|nr:ribonuclease R [Clostridiales bacterium]
MKRQNFTRRKFNSKPHYKDIQSGIVRANERGFAFITPDSGGSDFFVPRHSLNGAYHGDKVAFSHIKGTADEAVIVKVLERNPSPVVGTLVFERRSAKVFPDDMRRPSLYIPRDCLYGATDGQKVVCEITSFPKGRAPGGRVLEILGEEGDLYSEEISIIRAHGLREEFPDEVIKEAQKAQKSVLTLENRRDLRDKIIFTIDGEDTRDIDDAISIDMVDGNYVLGVHIADVSHYVKFRSNLDKEAYERGTSVYFPDRVLPMLPKELSNGICSLNEGEDRLTLTCEMTFDKSGKRKSYEIFESVICSRHKMTYPDVTAICEGDSALCEKYADIAERVGLMKDLCLILEERRADRGGVELDVKEAHIYVDEKGEIFIPSAQRTISQRIIEQFMISANEAVAEFMQSKKLPCLYRVHEKPSPEKTADLFAFLRDLGINAKGDCNNPEPKDFRRILTEAADKPYSSVVNKVMLRSMQKARYCGDNLKHFGLASECYCHFTSPIRRYPDLFVHRALKCELHGDGGKARSAYVPLLEKAGTDCSEKERIADQAERNVDDLYKLAYMSERIGEEFDGVISGVTSHGIYCELENTVEGVVPIEDLPADRYEYLEGKYILKGAKHRFRIGDSIRVQIVSCDLGRMKVIMKVCL